MNIMTFIRLVDSVVEERGLTDTTPMLLVEKKYYRDNIVCIEKRMNPQETVVSETGGRRVMHLRGINLLDYDESQAVFDHLLTLCPSTLPDVIADQD